MSFETRINMHHSCHAGGSCCENPCGARYVKKSDGTVVVIDRERGAESNKSQPETLGKIVHSLLGRVGLR